MQHYLKLNLPKDPLRYGFATESNRIIVHGYDIILEPEKILSDEILSKFNRMQLIPKAVVIFGHNIYVLKDRHKLIHTDIQFVDGEWKKLLFGINWEIEGSICKFTWWNMDKFDAVMPALPNTWGNGFFGSVNRKDAWVGRNQTVKDYQPRPIEVNEEIIESAVDSNLDEATKFKTLHGIHYVRRGHFGIPDGAIKLDETVIDGATLVRTDVPHMTAYDSQLHRRISVSVRFDESQFDSWNQVVEQLKPYSL